MHSKPMGRVFCSYPRSIGRYWAPQQIDFGDWATESYSIPVDPTFEDGQLGEDDLDA